MINYLQSCDGSTIYCLYELYREQDFIYDLCCQPVLTSELDKIKFNEVKPKYPNIKDISSEFYEGFGRDLLSD